MQECSLEVIRRQHLQCLFIYFQGLGVFPVAESVVACFLQGCHILHILLGHDNKGVGGTLPLDKVLTDERTRDS